MHDSGKITSAMNRVECALMERKRSRRDQRIEDTKRQQNLKCHEREKTEAQREIVTVRIHRERGKLWFKEDEGERDEG